MRHDILNSFFKKNKNITLIAIKTCSNKLCISAKWLWQLSYFGTLGKPAPIQLLWTLGLFQFKVFLITLIHNRNCMFVQILSIIFYIYIISFFYTIFLAERSVFVALSIVSHTSSSFLSCLLSHSFSIYAYILESAMCQTLCFRECSNNQWILISTSFTRKNRTFSWVM